MPNLLMSGPLKCQWVRGRELCSCGSNTHKKWLQGAQRHTDRSYAYFTRPPTRQSDMRYEVPGVQGLQKTQFR